jgi:iron(III) transport system ATP-binding protein
MKERLILNNLTVGYGNKSHPIPVIEKLNLTLAQGEIGCLLGKSGCGKSTLLRAIAGFHPLIEGSVTLNGRLLACASEGVDLPPEKRKIGFMFQDFALFPHLNIEKNIGFGLNKTSKEQRHQRIDEMLDLSGLTKYKKCYPFELSGGQQQRVALVRALAPEPELLLLDEPFSNLDEKSRLDLSSDVAKIIRQTSCKALMVTHNVNEARTMSDRMGFIESGKLSSWSLTSSDPYQARAIYA